MAIDAARRTWLGYSCAECLSHQRKLPIQLGGEGGLARCRLTPDCMRRDRSLWSRLGNKLPVVVEAFPSRNRRERFV